MNAMQSTPMSSSPDAVRSALAACTPLADLPPEVVDTTAERVWLRTLAVDEAVYRAGDPGDAMFVVASGTIAARLQSPDGDAVDLTAVRAGVLFGYLELFDGCPRAADAVAVAPSRVVVIPAAAAVRLFSSSPELVLALARDMARIVREHTAMVHEHAFYPAHARLARFLLAAAGADGCVRLEGPQVLLAQRLGIARQTLSRSLHRLATEGLVGVEPSGRVVTILDRRGLAAVTTMRTRRRGALQTTENPAGSGVRPVNAASSTGPRPSATATRAASVAASASTAAANATGNPVAAAMSAPCTASSKVRVGR
jgi:CRP/FNR family transcriptional regulator, cyclic AMP receptor protein